MSNNNGHNQEARETIQSFINRYASLYPNGDHVELIQLAAFPVAVTVHLLYQIWANFGTFTKNGVACKIDALAVNDCIQSNLFRQTGPDLFEMDADVRQLLLEDLRANRGKQFVKEELAAFLYQYSRQNTQGGAWRNYYDAQQWTAIMEVDEKAAAEQILSSLAQELQKKNTSRGLGIVNLIAALEKDNKQFSSLLQNALNKPDTAQTEPGAVTSKRIVLTDEMVDGRTPVRINLPPSLSNRLKKIVRTEQSVGEEREGRVYGLFVDFINERRGSDLSRIADLFAEKQYMPRENAMFLGAKELDDFRNRLDTLLSTAKKSDSIIIYINCQHHSPETLNTIITPQQLNDLLIKRFLLTPPDLIFVLEASSINSDWYTPKYPKFTLIATGGPVSEKSRDSLFERILTRSDRHITYAQFYNSLLQEFVQIRSYASIFNLPHFIPGELDWNQQLFSEITYPAMEELKKTLSDMAHEAVREDKLAELTEILEERIRDLGRNKVISLLQIYIATRRQKGANCMWLLQQEYDFNVQGPKGVFSQTVLWSHFFDETKNEYEQNMLEIVRALLETQILFIGLSKKLSSGLNPIRLRTIMNICRARKILLYFVLEENCEWQQLTITEDDLLLDGMILAKYLRINGSSLFLKTAYEEIENMLGHEELKKQDKQGKTYGIFVGINNYADKQFNLHESVNDARKMRVALEYAQLLEAENARMIIDKKATRTNVVSLLADRISTAGSEDTILFYFSGHSSNQQHDSALFFHDLDRTSEYTSKAQNGMLTDSEFNELIKTAPNNPTIVLILDTHGGSRHWLDESNPKHFSIQATHLEELCYELPGMGGMLTESITQCLSKQRAISYIDLYESVLNSFLAFSHDKNFWQTPLFTANAFQWNDIFLADKASESPVSISRAPKNYEELQTRDTLQCLYYSKTEQGAFTFYNQVKFALHEKRVDFERFDTWTAINKSFSVQNRFPDMICIALKESMYASEPRYNIEKLLRIADVMQIPVCFILEDKTERDMATYSPYSIFPSTIRPVISGEDTVKLIHELEAITEPLVRYLKPIEEEYETWGISIGITHYENLPGLPASITNTQRFSDWLSRRLKTKISEQHYHTFTSGPNRKFTKHDIDDSIFGIALKTLSDRKKRLFYIYVCGYALENADFLLCLPQWSERAARDVINLNHYVKMLAHGAFDKVIVFAEFAPLHMALKEPPVLNEPFDFTTDTFTSTPAPSCFFKVQLNLHDNTYSEKSGIMLDGLEGDAKLGNNEITVSSLTAYLNERAKREGIAQYPEIMLKDTNEKDFVIANLDPSFNPSDSTHTFKQKWILIVGSSKSRLSQPEWMVTNALAIALAKSGYGIITGGWRGVDAVISEAYAAQLAKDEILDEGYLIQVVLEKQEPEYPGGLIERVADEAQSYERIFARAYAVIMIGGMGGTFASFRKAEEANVPVIPIAITGGAAAQAHTVLKKRKLLPAYLLDELTKPVTNYEEAIRTADAVCNFLDEGFGKQYYIPNPA